MGNAHWLEDIIEKKLKDMHCAYIGKVVSTDGITAKVQPLGLIKEYGGQAKAQAVVENVPVACRYKISASTIYYATSGGGSASKTVAVPRQIAKDDLVVCICADRDITEARLGKNELPPAGRHNISDSIIVGIL